MEKTSVKFVDPNIIIPKLRSLGLGEQVVYHRGSLAADRTETPGKVGWEDVDLIGRTAYDLYMAKKVTLAQRRSDSGGGFTYIAIGI